MTVGVVLLTLWAEECGQERSMMTQWLELSFLGLVMRGFV